MRGRWLSTVIGLIALVAALAYIFSQRQQLEALSIGLRWIGLLPLVPLIVACVALNGFSLALFTRPFGVVLSPLECMGIAVATTFANYVGPFSAGLIARAGYLRTRHNLPYSRFLVLTSAQYLVFIGLAAFMGLTLSLMSLKATSNKALPLVVFFSLTALAMGALLLLPYELSWLKSLPMGERISGALEGWWLIRKAWGLLGAQVVISLLLLAAHGLALYFSFFTAGMMVSISQAMLMGLFLSLSWMVRLTPGNLGLQEIMLGLVAPLTGIPIEAGLTAALIFRAAVIATVFSFGPPASYLLAREAERSLARRP